MGWRCCCGLLAGAGELRFRAGTEEVCCGVCLAYIGIFDEGVIVETPRAVISSFTVSQFFCSVSL